MRGHKKTSGEAGSKKVIMSTLDGRADDNTKPPTLAIMKIVEGWREVRHGLYLIGCGCLEQFRGAW